MNVRDVVYETARQFAEIAASQYWIQQRVGDLNMASKEMRKALDDQKQYFYEVLREVGIVIKSQHKLQRKPKRKPAKKRSRVAKAKKLNARPNRRKENQPK